MYKYETHLHTAPVSRCAKASVRENLEYYKSHGYDGVFITNHFLGGNINIDPSRPYAEKIEFYFSDYEEALKIGKELGIQVFCGVELSHRGSDFLVYGLDKQWFLAHPDIMEMELPQRLNFMMECGALVIQAHPFREGTPMSLYHRCVQGVEVINANYMATYQLVKLYCEHYDLLPFAGSDNHYPAKKAILAGIACRERITSVEDMIQKVKSRQIEIFSQEVSPCI